MNKNFLHKHENQFEIPRIRLIAGILIGLGYSITFYSFLFLIREAFRIFSATLTHDLWILSDTEVYFYNLIFAFISVIFGQSVCFSFWFKNPKKTFTRYYLRQTSIVNDQRVFTWYFLSWFSKLAVVFGIMFGTTLHGAHYVFSFYPKYNYLFVLIIIVLFLSSWNNIRLTYKRQSLKWLLSSALIVSVISFGLSIVNIIDYKTINESYLQNSVNYNYLLELPESGIYSRLEKRSLIEDIYIVSPRIDKQIKPEQVIVINNQVVAFEDLSQKISELLSIRYEMDRKFTIFNLHIHKEIKVKFIKQVIRELSIVDVARVSYAVVPKNSKFDQRYYSNQAFQTRIPKYVSDSVLYLEAYNSTEKFTNKIEIREIRKNYCLVNDSLTDYLRLEESLMNQIALDSNYIIILHINSECDFSSYIKVMSYAYEAINKLRDLSSLNKFSKEYDLLEYDNRKEIRRKYPMRIFEIMEN